MNTVSKKFLLIMLDLGLSLLFLVIILVAVSDFTGRLQHEEHRARQENRSGKPDSLATGNMLQLQKQKDALASQMEQNRAETRNVWEKNTLLTAEIRKKNAEARRLLEDNVALVSQNAALLAQLEQTTNKSARTTPLPEMATTPQPSGEIPQLQALRQENADLTTQLAQMNAALADLYQQKAALPTVTTAPDRTTGTATTAPNHPLGLPPVEPSKTRIATMPPNQLQPTTVATTPTDKREKMAANVTPAPPPAKLAPPTVNPTPVSTTTPETKVDSAPGLWEWLTAAFQNTPPASTTITQREPPAEKSPSDQTSATKPTAQPVQAEKSLPNTDTTTTVRETVTPTTLATAPVSPIRADAAPTPRATTDPATMGTTPNSATKTPTMIAAASQTERPAITPPAKQEKTAAKVVSVPHPGTPTITDQATTGTTPNSATKTPTMIAAASQAERPAITPPAKQEKTAAKVVSVPPLNTPAPTVATTTPTDSTTPDVAATPEMGLWERLTAAFRATPPTQQEQPVGKEKWTTVSQNTTPAQSAATTAPSGQTTAKETASSPTTTTVPFSTITAQQEQPVGRKTLTTVSQNTPPAQSTATTAPSGQTTVKETASSPTTTTVPTAQQVPAAKSLPSATTTAPVQAAMTPTPPVDAPKPQVQANILTTPRTDKMAVLTTPSDQVTTSTLPNHPDQSRTTPISQTERSAATTTPPEKQEPMAAISASMPDKLATTTAATPPIGRSTPEATTTSAPGLWEQLTTAFRDTPPASHPNTLAQQEQPTIQKQGEQAGYTLSPESRRQQDQLVAKEALPTVAGDTPMTTPLATAQSGLRPISSRFSLAPTGDRDAPRTPAIVLNGNDGQGAATQQEVRETRPPTPDKQTATTSTGPLPTTLAKPLPGTPVDMLIPHPNNKVVLTTNNQRSEGPRTNQPSATDIATTRAQLLAKISRELQKHHIPAQVNSQSGTLYLPGLLDFDTNRVEIDPQKRQNIRELANVLTNNLICFSRDASQIKECAGTTGDIKLDALVIVGNSSTGIVGSKEFRQSWNQANARAMKTFEALLNAQPRMRDLRNTHDQSIFRLDGFLPPGETNPSRPARRVELRFVMEPPSFESQSNR